MRLDSKIVSGAEGILANWYEIAWREVFDVMELDRPYRASEIADRLICFQHLRPRTRSDYTKVILQRMAKEQTEQGAFHLIQHGEKWIAPSQESNWYAVLGIEPRPDA